MLVALYAFVGLVSLFVLDLICAIYFKIRSDAFYAPFHFVGGLLMAIFLFEIMRIADFAILGLNRSTLAVIGTVLVGASWELGEWLLWKLFLKKKKYKPGGRDTVNDLCLDLIGALAAILIIGL